MADALPLGVGQGVLHQLAPHLVLLADRGRRERLHHLLQVGETLLRLLREHALNHLGHAEKFRRVLNRRDWFEPLTSSREPHLRQGIVTLPVPTTPGPLGLAVWHTTGFLLGWDRHFQLLRDALKARRFFYYVVHPADLTCDEDFDGSEKMHLERAAGSREEKTRRLRESLAVIAEAGRDWVTMDRMAAAVRAA